MSNAFDNGKTVLGMLDLGAEVNLISSFLFEKLKLRDLSQTPHAFRVDRMDYSTSKRDN